MSGLEWIASAYILVFAGLLLVGGRLADVFGKRAAFLGGLGVFTLASLAAGLAGSQEMLIAARAAQGVGAALLTPTTLALLPMLFPDPRERGTAVGIWGGVGALALAVGPLTGGYLSQHASLGLDLPDQRADRRGHRDPDRRVDPRRERGQRRRLDLPGLVTSALALFALTYALIEGESKGWTSGVILGRVRRRRGRPRWCSSSSRPARPTRWSTCPSSGSASFSGGLLAMGAVGVRGVRHLLLHRDLPAERRSASRRPRRARRSCRWPW